jgi:CHAD domain-containing protein
LKRCQENFSEEAVHESRVETRRLLSTVELLDAFIHDGRIKKARRALKRHLDTFDDLRDTQVQLRYVSKMLRTFPAARLFHAYLLKREDRYTTATRKRIKRIKTRRLGQVIASCKEAMRHERKRRIAKHSHTILRRAVNRAFARVVRLKARIDPANTATLHRTRIAFKEFRYMVEALTALLPDVTEKRLAAMHHYQTMMGDIQDIEVLLATLGKFVKKKEVKAESARHFRDELLRRRQWLIQRYLNSAEKLREFGPLPVPEIKPAGPKKRDLQ